MAMGGAVGAIQGGVCGLGPVGMENLLVLVGPSDKMVDDYYFNRRGTVMAHIRTSAPDWKDSTPGSVLLFTEVVRLMGRDPDRLRDLRN